MLLAATVGAVAQPQPSEFPHHPGPNGLEAWALHANYSGGLAEYNQYPATLIIARRGRILRRIDGSPFLWSWIFLDGGKRVAYESGPLHGAMSCVLENVTTGKQLAVFDCGVTKGKTVPSWVAAIQSHGISSMP